MKKRWGNCKGCGKLCWVDARSNPEMQYCGDCWGPTCPGFGLIT